MHETNSNVADASRLAFEALAWILRDETRAERFLALTGLTADGLRTSVQQQATQAATLAFLEAHEPDLKACADAIGVTPVELVVAREVLER